MAMNIYCDNGDDDYIDMEIASYTSLFHHHRLSNSHAREFEFQMSSKSLDKDTTTSPADELFYKGKLLPLHLPPRLQMVEKLLETSSSNAAYEDFFSTPLETNVNSPTTTSTPYESCHVSRELNREEYLMEYSREANGFATEDNPCKSVTKKLKQSILGTTLKASKAYLKSLFSKSSAANERNVKEETVLKPKESSNAYAKMVKKTAFGQIHTERYEICTNAEKEKVGEDRSGCHRRSFSVSIKRHWTNKYSSFSATSNSSSSSSSSCKSSGLHESRYLKRSSSGSEIEKSIQGAIAHCKQSQQLLRSRKNTSAAVFCSFSAVCEEQEKPGLCRG